MPYKKPVIFNTKRQNCKNSNKAYIDISTNLQNIPLLTFIILYCFILSHSLANVFCYSLSECYFAGKGAALVLPPNERARPSKRVSAAGCDIQQHLQSMFYLLRPEETLKMVSHESPTCIPQKKCYLY